MKLPLMFGATVGLVFAQGIITTAVGTDPVFQENGRPARQVGIGHSEGIAVGPDGTVYFSDYDNEQVFKIGADGAIRVVAGNGLNSFSGDDGPATGASLSLPLRLAVDAKGNLYIADARNSRIRKVTPDGIIATVAGGSFGFAGDGGPATKASLNLPRGVALDSLGNLYIADTFNHRIRKVTSDGVIRTIAGTGTGGFSGDGGAAIVAQLNDPYAVAIDADGNVFIADTDNMRIRKISTADGTISTVFSGQRVTSVQFAADGTLYATANTKVVTISPSGTVVTVAGNGLSNLSGDGGKATAAALNGASDTAPGPGGTFYIADSSNYLIRLVDASGIISTFAGTGQFRTSPEGTPANAVLLLAPGGIKTDTAGNLYFTEPQIHRVRRVAPDGSVFAVAGTTRVGVFTDGSPAVQASLNNPADVAVDSSGNVYIANSFNSNIVHVDSQGKIFRFAGGGNSTAEGIAATTARLNQPLGVAVDASGVVYIADTFNHKIRKVTKDGLITTIAGTGAATFNGDGPALQASLNTPHGMALDAGGNLYIADTFNVRVRKLTLGGQLTTVAGNGVNGFPKEGSLASATALPVPYALAFDTAGNLYISGGTNQIYRVDTNGIITTVAGTGALGFSGDGGPALLARLSAAQGVAVDASGNILISDTGNNRVRVVLATPPSFNVAPSSLSFTAPAGGSPTSPQTLSISTTAPGGTFSVTNNLPTWLSVSPMLGTLPSALQVVADPGKLTQGTYTQTLTINVPNAVPAVRTVSVTFTVTSAAPPHLSVTQTSLSFAFGAGSPPSQQSFVIQNSGGGSLPFTISTATSSGGTWLSTSVASGIAPVTVSVSAAPGTLAPGAYLGTITVVSPSTNERAVIAVTMTINALRQSIQLSQSGLTFTAVAAGGFVLPQSFSVLNTGQGVLNWTATPTTLSGGPWLSVSPASGATDAASNMVPAVQVSVNASALGAGTYYGRVVVAASTADNSPQMVAVVLNVLPAGTNPGPQVQPSALIFTGVAGGAQPSSQNIFLGNSAGKTLAYVSGRLTLDGADWFFVAPPTGAVPVDQAATIVVQPVIDSLTAGVRRGVLTLLFTDGSTRTVSLLLVLASGGGGSSTSPDSARDAGGCTPTKLLPLVSSVLQDFNIPAAWPTAVTTKVVDDCGNLMTSGSVTASFSNGDPPLSLFSLKDGNWSATWQPRNSTVSQASINIAAQIPEQKLQGSISISGSLQKNPDPPQVSAGGVVSAASFGQAGVIAPGSFISIYGTRFADGINVAPAYPWTTELVGTEVILGGSSLPLYFTSTGQINAVVPNDVPVNTRQQLIVRRGLTYTAPESVSIAAAQPAVFTPSQSGQGQGYVLVHDAAGIETLADPSKPAHAGDVLVTYCAGLGVTNPAIPAGSPASLTALSPTVNSVTMTVGGVNAPVFFAGLAPGFVGLYQVNATMPTGVTPGDAVVVVLIVGGQSSPPVTMSVR